MQKTYKNVEVPKKTICLCCHCGERFGGDANGNCALFCKSCRKSEDRKRMDTENKKIWEERGLTFKCEYCG
jgi:hypothetical protein